MIRKSNGFRQWTMEVQRNVKELGSTAVSYFTTILTVNLFIVFIYDPLQILAAVPDRFEQFEFGVEFRVWRHYELIFLFAQLFAHLLFSHPVLLLQLGHSRSVGGVLPSVQPGSIVRVPADFDFLNAVHTTRRSTTGIKNEKL